MRKMVLVLLFMVAWTPTSGLDTYNELIMRVCQACETPRLLLTTAFTNDVMAYRTVSTNFNAQCAADLALAISLMHRMDEDEESCANDECFGRHQSLVSNVVYCTGLDDGSWIRYAAAVEYMAGLNYGNQQDAAFVLSTNMITRIGTYPPNMGSTNYWSSMSRWMRSPNETILTVFRVNAAIWLAEHNRIGEIVSLTNSLPASAINIFFEELER